MDEIIREAKLFEAGDYPDKGLSVTEDELDAIAAGTPAGTPVNVEHESTPFDGMGVIRSVYRVGKALMGRIAFPQAAWDFLESMGAKALSAGVKRDKSGLAEVSIVRNPRIADAQIFKADNEAVAYFSADVAWSEPSAHESIPDQKIKTEVDNMSDQDKAPPAVSVPEALQTLHEFTGTASTASIVSEAAAVTKEFTGAVTQELVETARQAREAIQALQQMKAETLVARFKREGKILPAAEPFARALLSCLPVAASTPDTKESVTFNDETAHFAAAFVKFLEAMTPAINFKELSATANGEVSEFNTPEAAEFFSKLGLDAKHVAETVG